MQDVHRDELPFSTPTSTSASGRLRTRVLIVCFNVSRTGGAERLTLDAVQAIRGLGATCEIVDTRRLGDAWLGRQLGRLFFLYRLIKGVAAADVVISMHQALLGSIFACLALLSVTRIARRPRVLCWLLGIEVWGTAGKRAVPALKRCDGLIAISNFTRDRVITKDGTWPPCELIHPLATTVNADAPLTAMPRDMVVLTVSRLSKGWDYKGHGRVLRSLRILKERGRLPASFRWRIVGDGDLRHALEEEVAKAGLSSFVTFLGSVGDDELEHEYRNCRLFVMPSAYSETDGAATGEGFGIVYLEAANAGRPSIACRKGGQADIIVDGVSGWLVEGEPMELAELLEKLMSSPESVERAGLKAHEIAKNRFGATHFSEGLRKCVWGS